MRREQIAYILGFLHGIILLVLKYQVNNINLTLTFISIMLFVVPYIFYFVRNNFE